jgi:ubiquinone/menaquinone biosynthesis C-methylase UbiE
MALGKQYRESIISRIIDKSGLIYDLTVLAVHFGARGKRYDLIPRLSGRTLEIGCGTGKSSLRANETMHVDINPKFLKRGLRKKRFLNAICASAYHLPFKEKTFDSILVPDTFHHLVYHDKLFRECRRTLKDNNARLCIFDPVKVKNGTNKLQSTADGITWNFTLQGLCNRILKLSKTHKFKIQSSKIAKCKSIIHLSGWCDILFTLIPFNQ